ncbi:hypothetical protein U1Q18_051503 [Sarracenia purpurea var. burkii]
MNRIPNHACESVEENESDEERYVYHVALPSLQEMAINRAALAMWYSYISRTKYNEFEKQSNDDLLDGLDISDEYWQECNSMIESLRMPRSIEIKLKTALELVCDETRSWIRRYRYDMFSSNLQKYLKRRFDVNCCVWLPNGKIDYGKTGPKMLTTRGLSGVQKFAIMSEFCMKNEIEKFGLRSLPKPFIKAVNFNRDYLIYYWVLYLKNDLQSLPLNDFASTDIAMAAMCVNEHWTAFKYFWNRLSIADQVTVAVLRCSSVGSYPFHQPEMLSMMSWEQQRSVLYEIPDQILLNFWICFEMPESAVWTWNHSKDLITVVEFAKMANKILYHAVEFEEDMRLFMQIWYTASDEQRNHVSRSMEDEIIKPSLR